MLYREKKRFDTLKWDDIFTSSKEFRDKVDAIASDFGDTLAFEPYNELYYILSLKYVSAHTRYTDEFNFIMSLIRELRVVWPIYKMQKALMNDMMEEDLENIRKQGKTIRNKVENPNVTNNDPSETIIKASTEQETMLHINNLFTAVREKYATINRNYQNQIYNATDKLFRQIISDDTVILFNQKE